MRWGGSAGVSGSGWVIGSASGTWTGSGRTNGKGTKEFGSVAWLISTKDCGFSQGVSVVADPSHSAAIVAPASLLN
jgi:hypothetical protein